MTTVSVPKTPWTSLATGPRTVSLSLANNRPIRFIAAASIPASDSFDGDTLELGADTPVSIPSGQTLWGRAIEGRADVVVDAAEGSPEAAGISTIGTRTYGAGTRVAVAATSAVSGAIVASEVLLHASTRCFVREGSGTPAAVNTDIPLEAGEKFHMRITSGNKIAVIRDTADGFLNIVPVA